MRPLLLVALLLPAVVHAQPFDARLWLNDALALTAAMSDIEVVVMADTAVSDDENSMSNPFYAEQRLAEQLDEAVRWSRGCTDTSSELGARPLGWGTLWAYPLQSGNTLVVLGCDAGAYTDSSVFLLFSDSAPGDPVLLSFGHPVGTMWVIDPQMWRMHTQMYGFYDMQPDGTLSFFQAARGLGDCGRMLTYQLVEERPLLREIRQRECDDETIEQAGDPATWPILWRAE